MYFNKTNQKRLCKLLISLLHSTSDCFGVPSHSLNETPRLSLALFAANIQPV